MNNKGKLKVWQATALCKFCCSTGNMNEIICRGKWGLDGLVNFVMYFVKERGMSEGLFEGKLANLVERDDGE